MALIPSRASATGAPRDALGDPPPVSSTFKLLVYKNYLKTQRRWVALCVVNDGSENSLRFYKWKWDQKAAAWKVDLARFSVADIDLGVVAVDAREFARSFKIPLNWKSV
jgi:hypothetical protein